MGLTKRAEANLRAKLRQLEHALRESTDILTGALNDHECVDTETVLSHNLRNAIGKQRAANKGLFAKELRRKPK
jgi:hypothetical protein